MVIFYTDQDNNRDRIDGPAAIWDYNCWEFHFNGKCHRDRKPATKTEGTYRWYNNGKVIAKRKK